MAEREKLVTNFKALENRLNLLEHRERQNNAMVKGIPGITAANVLTELNKVLGQLDEPAAAESARVVLPANEKQGALILARFKSWDEKITVFKQRKALVYKEGDSRSTVYISDDLTKREKEIKFYQRKYRREQIGNGSADVKFKGEKVCVDGVWKCFDETTKSFINEKN